MAHELDITGGTTSFANSRTDAWHRLGQSVGHTMTAAEALTAAHLAGWNVRKLPLQIPQPASAPIPVPDQFATVRTNPITGATDYLGVVGSKYTPVQNEQSCVTLDALVDESGAHFETAGALKGGRETFVTMKLPKAMTFDGRDGTTDRTEWYIAALNSHDGSSKFRLLVTPIRIVCANTQAAALRNAQSSIAISHTGGFKLALQQARAALRLSFTYIDAFEAEAARLYASAMDLDQMRDFAHRLVKRDDAPSAAARTKRTDQARQIVKLWVSSPTVAPISGTRWGAYNAVTEYIDHFAPVRGARTSTAAADTRALRAVTAGSPAHTMKVDAFRMLQTL